MRVQKENNFAEERRNNFEEEEEEGACQNNDFSEDRQKIFSGVDKTGIKSRFVKKGTAKNILEEQKKKPPDASKNTSNKSESRKEKVQISTADQIRPKNESHIKKYKDTGPATADCCVGTSHVVLEERGVNTEAAAEQRQESEVYLQNYAALNAFFHSALRQLKVMKTNTDQERRMVNSVESLFSEGDSYCSEGERLENKGEMALSLAFFTNAASKFKQITALNNLSSEEMLRAQIRRESCLKKARTMYRRLLVQSAQKTQNQPPQQQHANNLRSSRKTNQVRTEKRPCTTCDKLCFWLKEGLCSDCDLKATEVHRRNVRRNVGYSSRTAAPRDFTRPRSNDNIQSFRTRRVYQEPEYSESSSEEEFAPVKSCAICHTYRQQQPAHHHTYRRRCC